MGERGIAEMGVLYGCGAIFLEIRGKYFLFLPEFGEDESNLTREHQPKLLYTKTSQLSREISPRLLGDPN